MPACMDCLTWRSSFILTRLASRQALLCLLDNGSDANAHDIAGNTALHHCACADPGNALSEALVFMALVLVSNYGADVNARNCAGRQALVNWWKILLNSNRGAVTKPIIFLYLQDAPLLRCPPQKLEDVQTAA